MSNPDDTGATTDATVLGRKRAAVKGQLTKLEKEIDTQGRAYDEIALDGCLDRLKRLYARFLVVQDRLEEVDTDEIDGEERDEYDQRHSLLRNSILRLKETRKRSVGALCPSSLASAGSSSSVQVLRSELPHISLPEFSGKYTEWASFWSTFRALVDNDTNIDDTIKFAHLLRCVKGHARDVISTLDPTAANYAQAKKLLSDRYENKRRIFQDHVASVFELACMSDNTPDELLRLVNKVNGHLDSLRLLGDNQQILDCLLIHLVLGKLVDDLQLRWERKALPKEIPTWKKISDFMITECQSMEHHEMVRRHFKAVAGVQGAKGKGRQTESIEKKAPKKLGTTAMAAAPGRSKLCFSCKSPDHSLYACPDFSKLDRQGRYEKVKALHLCMNCLLPGHTRRDCKAGNCRRCNSRHHTLLHGDDSAAPRSNGEATSAVSDQEATNTGSDALSATLSGVERRETGGEVVRTTLLATAMVGVETVNGDSIQARALLDAGSQSTFITERLAVMLAIPRSRANITVNGIGGRKCQIKTMIRATIRSNVTDFSRWVQALVIPSIVWAQPGVTIKGSALSIPPDVTLADPTYYKPGAIDLLIGADLFYDVLGDSRIRLGDGLPILQSTEFGWVVAGAAPLEEGASASCMAVQRDESLDSLVRGLWEREEITESPRISSPEEQLCEEKFIESVRQEVDGRFSLLLPFREAPSALGDSFPIAESRFRSLERRFEREPELALEYRKAIGEFLHSGFAEILESPDYAVLNILPQQAVVKGDSTTFKVRPVFDASCPTKSGRSLNDILCVGPTIQDDLFTILVLARACRYLISADIAKMYLQVIVLPPDCNLQCILWRDSPREPLKVIRINRVTFGTAPASFLAVRCLHELADRYGEQYPVGASVLKRDFYVDNMFSGANTPEQLREIWRQTSDLLGKGCFPLRKWATNCSEVLEEIPESDRESLLRLDDLEYMKALGLAWLPVEDVFVFKYSIPETLQVRTRREALSLLTRVYDLLGLINPVVTFGKILLQQTWNTGLGWDDPLPQELQASWQQFREQLCHLASVRVPRCALIHEEGSQIQLHGFADASEKAFGAVLYAVSSDPFGTKRVGLIAARSRVAPRKTVTLARLELYAMVLLAELLVKVQSALKLSVEVNLWSDSTIALYWVRRPPSEWSTYVANRVAKVQRMTEGATWRHIPGTLNPADLCSRGLMPSQLTSSEIWFKGPDFLLLNSEEWPKSCIPDALVKGPPVTTLASTSEPPDLVEQWFSGCKIRVFRDLFLAARWSFAYFLRFRNKQSCLGELTAAEILESEIFIVRIIQRKFFSEEYRNLTGKRQVPMRSQLRQLSPFLDKDGLIRVGGRLEHSDLSYDGKHPILLPRKHPFVLELVRHYHGENMHVGQTGLLSIIRSKYWVIRGKELCRKIIHACRPCQRTAPRVAGQLMGMLPPERVREAEAFQYAGVDFFGPILIHYNRVRGKTPVKAYAALFICLATKAIHLELARDLSMEAFLRALNRFVDRRGKPDIIWSDNATNFTSTNRFLKESSQLFSSEKFFSRLFTECADRGIQWKFVPARSQHFGGIWEAAVKQAKSLLKRSCSAASYTEDELETILCDAEAVLNSRPIVPLSEDSNDFRALSPSHFISSRGLRAIPQPLVEADPSRVPLLSRYRRVLYAKQIFWRQWSRVYLQELQKRAKWHTDKPNIKVGDLVLVREMNSPPRQWPLARVIELHPGRDERVRVVTLKTPKGQLQRSIHQLCPLNTD